MEEVDWSVGQLLDTIRELRLESRTLVIFVSDNGGTSRGSNGPLRGFKGSTWEGGIRVPAIAWWPGQIPAGTSSDAVTGMFDLLPTLAKLAGTAPPADRTLDGMDIWPVLAGEPDAKGHDVFYYFRGFRLEAVRSGPWKLHLGAGGPAQRNRNASPATPELYNLERDLGESTNVAAEHAEVVTRLTALAEAMASDLGVDGIGPGCRELGRDPNPLPWISHDGTYRVVAP